jgi:methyl halide transferase
MGKANATSRAIQGSSTGNGAKLVWIRSSQRCFLLSLLVLILPWHAEPAQGQHPIKSPKQPPVEEARNGLGLLHEFATRDQQRLDQTSWMRVPVPFPDSSQLDAGDILAYEENRNFTYVVVDASKIYYSFHQGRPGGTAPRLVRRIIHLKPATFVIDDQVTAPAGTAQICWSLVAPSQPMVAGQRIVLSAKTRALTAETLLPRGAAVAVERKGPAAFRVQVTANATQGEARFLNVLHVGDAGQQVIPAAEADAIGGQLTLTIRAGEMIHRLSLPKGQLGPGDIEIARTNGQSTLARRLLASGVLPSGPDGTRMLEGWDSAYHAGRRPPWDTGRTCTELKNLIKKVSIRPGKALELGCGTGTNAIYLASEGFQVTAVDVAPTALNLAMEKARKAGVKVRWLLADVTALPELGTFDFIFDRGCYHGVRRENAASYVETIRRCSRTGTRFLLLAGNANEPPPHYGPPRVTEAELRDDFGALLDFEDLRETRFDTPDPGGKGALAWSVLLRRTEKP